jgi:hypothetical protein
MGASKSDMTTRLNVKPEWTILRLKRVIEELKKEIEELKEKLNGK